MATYERELQDVWTDPEESLVPDSTIRTSAPSSPEVSADVGVLLGVGELRSSLRLVLNKLDGFRLATGGGNFKTLGQIIRRSSSQAQ